MRQAKNFFYCILPSILTSCAMGICPIFINFKGQRPVLYTSKYLYSINIGYLVLYSMLLLRTISEAKNTVMSNNYYQSNKVSNFGIAYMFASGVTYLYITYISCLFRTESVKKTLTRISEVDRIFQKFNSDLKYTQSIIYQFVTQAATLLLIIITTLMQQQNIRRERFRVLSVTTWCVFVLPVAVVNVFENQFAYTILLMKQRFEVLNNELNALDIISIQTIKTVSKYQEKPNLTLKKLDVLMRMHDELCSISRKIASNYTLPVAVNLAFQFSILLFCIFYCYWMFSLKPFSSICWMSWSMLKISEVLHISIASHLASHHAQQTSTIVHKLLLKPMQTEIWKKLINFSQQLMHGHVRLTIWGLFPINATLLFTMIGAAATYMTIMLQFQQASLPMTCKTNLVNSTKH